MTDNENLNEDYLEKNQDILKYDNSSYKIIENEDNQTSDEESVTYFSGDIDKTYNKLSLQWLNLSTGAKIKEK